jgi:hypothetical protein
LSSLLHKLRTISTNNLSTLKLHYVGVVQPEFNPRTFKNLKLQVIFDLQATQNLHQQTKIFPFPPLLFSFFILSQVSDPFPDNSMIQCDAFFHRIEVQMSHPISLNWMYAYIQAISVNFYSRFTSIHQAAFSKKKRMKA